MLKLKLKLSPAAQKNVEETSTNPLNDIERLMVGEITADDLLIECLHQSDTDRIQGWKEYCAAVDEYSRLASQTIISPVNQ